MSAFSERLINGMRTAYHYIVGNDNNDKKKVAAQNTAEEVPAQQSDAYLSSPISVVNPSGKPTGQVGEQLIINGKQKNNSTKTKAASGEKTEKTASKKTGHFISNHLENRKPRNTDVESRMAAIMQKCIDNGITTKEEFEEKVIGKQFHEQIFNNFLPVHVRAKMLNKIEQAVDEYIKLKKKHKINNNVDESKMLHEHIELAAEADKKGVNIFDKAVGNVIEELGGNKFFKLSDEEKVKAIIDNDKKWRTKGKEILKRRLAECSTEQEKQKVIEEERTRIRFYERVRCWILIATTDGKVAINSVQNMDARDMDYGFGLVLNAQKTQEAKSNAANSIKGHHFTDIIAAYHARGEYPPQETVQNATQILVSQMTEPYIKGFESYFYEYRQGIKNGTIKNPVFTKEELTATSSGIGTGIVTNVTMMTSEQKTELLATWDNHASKFDDYKTVKTECKKAVDKYIQEHPENKEQVEKIKENLEKTADKITEKDDNAPKEKAAAKKSENNVNTGLVSCSKLTAACSDSASAKQKQEQKSKLSAQTPVVKAKPTDEQVANELRTTTLENVKSKYRELSDKELAGIIASKNLKQYIPVISNTLNAMNIAEKIDLVNKASYDMKIAIIRKVSPKEALKISEFASLDFDTRKESKKIIKESTNHEFT